MRPGILVAAAVESEEEEHERCDQQSGPEEVDPLEPGFVMLLDRDLDEEEDKEAGDADEGNLDQKGPSPADPVVQPAAERPSEAHAETEDDVAIALPDTAAAEGDQVSADEDGNRVQSTSAHPGDDATGDDDAFRLGEAADQTAGAEEDIGENKARTAPENVGQFAAERLACGVGDEIASGEPGQERKRVEVRRYGTCKSGNNGGVCSYFRLICDSI